MAKIIVIGGGVIGCAVARELTAYDACVTVLERNDDVATGTSKANSGIVHAGFDAHTGTLKAKFNVLGARLMESESKTLDFPFRRNGAYVLNFEEAGNAKLEELKAQGEANGVEGLRIMTGEEVRAEEPEVSGEVVSALYAPTSGIVGPYEMTIAYAENAAKNGAKFVFNALVERVEKTANGFRVVTSAGEYECDAVVNCAGVHSDDINNTVCEEKERIVGRKGEYMLLDKSEGHLAYATLFQLPTAMGKGVLVSPTVHGNIIVGPTALDVPDRDDADTTVDGLNSAWAQAAKSVPALNRRTIITQFAGVRAHNPKNDFIVGESSVKGFFNALGIESPGLTSAPAIGKYLAAEVAKSLNLGKNAAFDPYRAGIKAFARMTDKEREEAIAKNPLYGKVVCRCEVVTEGEIVDAIHRTPGAVDLDGLKRRTRAGMGRCQAGFCTPRLMEILARETGKDFTEISKKGKGSEIVVGKTGEAFKPAEEK